MILDSFVVFRSDTLYRIIEWEDGQLIIKREDDPLHDTNADSWDHAILMKEIVEDARRDV